MPLLDAFFFCSSIAFFCNFVSSSSSSSSRKSNVDGWSVEKISSSVKLYW